MWCDTQPVSAASQPGLAAAQQCVSHGWCRLLLPTVCNSFPILRSLPLARRFSRFMHGTFLQCKRAASDLCASHSIPRSKLASCLTLKL